MEGTKENKNESRWADCAFTGTIRKYCGMLASRDKTFASAYSEESLMRCIDDVMDMIEGIVRHRDDPNVPDKICYRMVRDWFIDGKLSRNEFYIALIADYEKNMESELFGESNEENTKTDKKPVNNKQPVNSDQIDLFSEAV